MGIMSWNLKKKPPGGCFLGARRKAEKRSESRNALTGIETSRPLVICKNFIQSESRNALTGIETIRGTPDSFITVGLNQEMP